MRCRTRAIVALIGCLAITAVYATPARSGVQYHTDKPSTRPAAAAVRIDNFSYQPKTLTIAVGTTVTWTNADDIPHTVTSRDDPPAFDSGAIDTDEKFSFTFKTAGTYSYYCKVHPHMRGQIVVN
jgi:plastocyanin